MSYVVVDVESDGPIPAEFSMVCFGAVIFDDLLDKTFYGGHALSRTDSFPRLWPLAASPGNNT